MTSIFHEIEDDLNFLGNGRPPQFNISSDMRYFADAADAVCVNNIKLCVKFMLELRV
jgi:hypothetical protein